MIYDIIDYEDNQSLGHLETDAPEEVIQYTIDFVRKFEEFETNDLIDMLIRMGYPAEFVKIKEFYF